MRARLVIAVLVVMGLAYGAVSGWRHLVRYGHAQFRATVPLVFDDDSAEAMFPSFEVARRSSTYDLEGSRQVTIDNPFGNVAVGSGGSQVTVESVAYTHARTRQAAAAKAAAFRVVKTRQADGPLTIAVIGDREVGHVTIDLTVRVPADIALQVKAEAGNVQVADLRGPVTVGVGSGDVDARRLQGPADLSTESGNVVVGGAARGLVAHTGSGNLRLSDVSGDTSARSDSGNTELTVLSSRQITVRGRSGDMTVTVLQPFSGRLEARTESGNVGLSLAPGSDCHVSVVSRSGNAECTLPLEDMLRAGQAITGRLGRGTGEVTVRTESGNATVRGTEGR